MSLHTTVVGPNLAGHHPHRGATEALAQPSGAALAGRLSGMSMRLLETSLALTAIATAILIGLGR